MNEYEFLLKLLVCFLLSFFIGIERQYRKRVIGLRTTILVSLGAFLFVSFSFSVGSNDVSRIASQVVTGIGFLGAGVILKDGKKIRGLTTAATLWCVASIGVLCAGGAIFEAILGTIIILFANIILRYVNKVINNISDNKNTKITWNLKITGTNKEIIKINEEIQTFLSLNKANLTNRTIKSNKDTNINLEFNVSKEITHELENFINKILDDYKIKDLSLKKISEINKEEFDDEV